MNGSVDIAIAVRLGGGLASRLGYPPNRDSWEDTLYSMPPGQSPGHCQKRRMQEPNPTSRQCISNELVRIQHQALVALKRGNPIAELFGGNIPSA
jgi:hypothetical protein